MNIQRKNSAHHFRMQSEREQTLTMHLINGKNFSKIISGDSLALSIQLLLSICSHIQYRPLCEILYQLFSCLQLQQGFIFFQVN